MVWDTANGDLSARRVLAVDDDHAIRVLYERVLTRVGLECVIVASGAEALERVKAESFGVVLLDSRMPGMSGWEVLESLRADPETQSLPVILVTGNTEPEDRARGFDIGANDYVVKPFEADDLVVRVRAQLSTGARGGSRELQSRGRRG